MVSAVVDRRLALAGNTGMKSPVTVVATAAVTQAGEQTIDGIAVLASNAGGVPDRVLCTAQSDATLNGIWDVQTSAWTRSDDADGTGDLARGTTVAVARGSAALQVWSLTSADPIVVGTTSQTWQQALSMTTLGAVLTVTPGSGQVSSYNTLAAAVTALGSARGDIIIRSDQTLAASVTVPATAAVFFDGSAQITTTGFTLTFNGGFSSAGVQRFAGTGTVAFGSTAQVDINAAWWGTSVANLNTALSVATGREITVSGAYSCGSTTVTVPAATKVKATDASLTWSGNVTGISFGSGCSWEGGTLTGAGNSSYNDSGRAMQCVGTNNSPSAPTYVTGPKIRDVTITGWAGYGVRMQYCDGGEVVSCTITSAGYAGIALLSCKHVAAHSNLIDGVSPGTSGGDAYGIFFDRSESGTETADPRSTHIKVHCNTVKNVAASSGNNGQGIDTHGATDSSIIGNTIEACELGIALVASKISGVQQLACQRVTVIGNTIKDTARVGYGIVVAGALNGSTVNEYADGCVVEGNTVIGHGVATDDTSGAVLLQATRGLVINSNRVRAPSPHGIYFNLENVGFVCVGNQVQDPYDNSVGSPACIKVAGNNNKGHIAENTLYYSASALGTNEAVHAIRIGSGLTGLDISFGSHQFLGIDSSHLAYSEATSTGVNAANMMVQRGSGTLSGGTQSVTFAKRFPAAPSSVLICLSGALNPIRASSITATGFTATGTGTDTYTWRAEV